MSIYTCQAKATEKFGITFRSQLEAKWSYALFTAVERGLECQWDYVDEKWKDFDLILPRVRINLEVKPYGPQFLEQAISRWLNHVWDDVEGPSCENLLVVMGEPKDISGDGLRIGCSGAVLCGMGVTRPIDYCFYSFDSCVDFCMLEYAVDYMKSFKSYWNITASMRELDARVFN